MAKAKGIVAWAPGTDPLSPEERQAKREQGKALIAKMKAEAGRHKDVARRERKVQKLNTMGPEATQEKKRMRVSNYGGGKPTAGTAWQPKGDKNYAR